MKSLNRLVLALVTLTAAAGVLLLTGPAFGQGNTAASPLGVPDDWSHRHLIFSDPGSFDLAVKGGFTNRWLSITRDVRFQLQQLKRSIAARSSASIASGGASVSVAKKRQLRRDWSMSMGTGTHGTAGVFPAKYNFLTNTASCSDFVVFPSGAAGSGTTVPSIIAYTNIYSGCGTTHPTVNWSYNVNGGNVTTSPVLSLDGTQVAFVATMGTAANLVVLKPSSSTSTVSITSSNSNANTCTAPCAQWISLGALDGVSSPFYDYANNVLYVGDNAGVLHKFTNVFAHYSGGTNITALTQITGGGTSSGWPQTIVSAPLSSPVFDSASGNVFVGSGQNISNGHAVHRVPAGGGSNNIVNSARLAGTGIPINDAPLVDSSAAKVYAFVHDDEGASCSGNGNHAGVYQLSTTFTANNCGAEQQIGFGENTTGATAYSGAFDNIYYSSASASNPSGNLYVCGRASANLTPTIYRIPITNNAMGTPVAGPPLGSVTAADCSPVTEFYNGSADFIFLSVDAAAPTTAPISCPSGNSGCIMSFTVTNGTQTWDSTHPSTTAKLAAPSGTSAIVIDNLFSGTPAGTQQVYFGLIGTQACAGAGGTGTGSTGCAVQASQSLLQ